MLTWVEINKQALKHNLAAFRRLIGKKVLLMPVLKSNAYGHGLLEVAAICDHNKNVDRICVVNLEEAIALIQNKISKPIMILSFYELDSKSISLAIKHGVIFPVYSLEQVKFLNKIALGLKTKVKVHLKIDTGATRLGVMPNQIVNFAKETVEHKNIILEGLWSHFASSESDPVFTEKQHSVFEQALTDLKKIGIDISVKHLASSTATAIYKNARFNAIRLGISTYGLYADKKSENIVDLQPVLTLNTKIIQVKQVPANTKIGYGGTFVTKKTSTIAVLPVGYWDGIDRKLSNNGEVIIKGKKCPIRGRICMNLMMVDVSGVKNSKVGDKAIIIGQQGRFKITAEDLASKIGTINYEVVTRINPLIPRITK